MLNGRPNKRALIEGRPSLIAFDIQKSIFAPLSDDERAIAHTPDYAARMARTRRVVDRAREVGIPVVFIREVHRADPVAMGRETDGDEEIRCLDRDPLTSCPVEELGTRPDDCKVQKRRHLAFYGTDLEILLRGLKAGMLILTGELRDVCAHCTFVDGRQDDFFCRGIEDSVADSSLEAHNAALRAMEYLQRCAV